MGRSGVEVVPRAPLLFVLLNVIGDCRKRVGFRLFLFAFRRVTTWDAAGGATTGSGPARPSSGSGSGSGAASLWVPLGAFSHLDPRWNQPWIPPLTPHPMSGLGRARARARALGRRVVRRMRSSQPWSGYQSKGLARLDFSRLMPP